MINIISISIIIIVINTATTTSTTINTIIINTFFSKMYVTCNYKTIDKLNTHQNFLMAKNKDQVTNVHIL